VPGADMGTVVFLRHRRTGRLAHQDGRGSHEIDRFQDQTLTATLELTTKTRSRKRITW
jgi:hypothetical protein